MDSEVLEPFKLPVLVRVFSVEMRNTADAPFRLRGKDVGW